MAEETHYGEVDVPADIFVRCPDIAYKFRQARRCDGCPHFKGLAQRVLPEGAQQFPFREEFMVRCTYPVNRELYNVEIEAPLA